MAWNTVDPWAKAASSAGGWQRQGMVASDKYQAGADVLDPRAMAAAMALMTINAKHNVNRQCAAAISSALFNLLVTFNREASPAQAKVSEQAFSPTITIGQLAQDMMAQQFDQSNITSLADALRIARRLLPPQLCRKLQELNSAASYGRHHGACTNSRLLQELATALEGLPKTADVEEEGSVGESKPDGIQINEKGNSDKSSDFFNVFEVL
jgi:acyl-homoserine lactone acylase PvdQ